MNFGFHNYLGKNAFFHLHIQLYHFPLSFIQLTTNSGFNIKICRVLINRRFGQQCQYKDCRGRGVWDHGSPFALAMTGDSGMSARIQKVLKTELVGRSKLDLNVLPLPKSVYPGKAFLKYGTKGCSTRSENDSFNILARFAGARDEVAWAA